MQIWMSESMGTITTKGQMQATELTLQVSLQEREIMV